MVRNIVYVPYKGSDPKILEIIPKFENTGKKKFKVIAAGFRLSGKIGKFVQEHEIAYTENRYNWNGYGYQDKNRLFLLSPKDGKTLSVMLAEKKEKDARNKRPIREETAPAWARRLSRLSDIPYDECLTLAYDKLDYQEYCISALEERQAERYSVKRQKLIEKVRRENPLRRIKDENHAKAVWAAHRRHTSSDYEEQLDNARSMAEWGLIDPRYVKEYAREHTTYDNMPSDAAELSNNNTHIC